MAATTGGWMITCVAVMVVPFVVPSARTFSPFAIALADAGLIPFWYAVAEVSSTVTFWPADVVIVKPDVESASTVPTAPPAAGADRAFDPPPADPPAPLGSVVVVGCAAVDEWDVARPTATPIAVAISAATTPTIHRRLLFGAFGVSMSVISLIGVHLPW